jgi:hypothetical protein
LVYNKKKNDTTKEGHYIVDVVTNLFPALEFILKAGKSSAGPTNLRRPFTLVD